jgi:hypothetical protein
VSKGQHRFGALVRAPRFIVVAAVAAGAMVLGALVLGVSSSGAQSGCAIEWTGAGFVGDAGELVDERGADGRG